MGLRFGALIGHGAGYGVYDKLKEALGTDVNYFFNVDPISIWLTNEKALKPGLAEIIKMVGEEYEKARPGTVIKSAHVGMAASNTYVLLTEVLPLAIRKYGGFDADALRNAALSVDLPEGGTMLGFGVKFGGEEARAPARTSEHSRSSSSTSTTSHTWYGRRACRFASPCCRCRPRLPTRNGDRGATRCPAIERGAEFDRADRLSLIGQSQRSRSCMSMTGV